jgi:hypothetical protein
MGMTGKFAYSYDRQDFTGAYDSAEEAVRAAVEQAESLSNPPTEIYVGQLVDPDPQVAHHAEAIVAAMNSRAHVDFGDQARNYVGRVLPEQLGELDVALAETISAWLKRHGLTPSFRVVRQVREYPMLFPGGTLARQPEGTEVHEIGTVD